MSAPNPSPAPADNGKPVKAATAKAVPAGAAVIRRLGGTEESAHERLVKKHVPAWVASGAVHLVIALVLFFIFGGRQAEALQSSKVLDTTAEKETEEAIILSGSVSTYYHKQLAQETLMPLRGSRALHNRVIVIRS